MDDSTKIDLRTPEIHWKSPEAEIAFNAIQSMISGYNEKFKEEAASKKLDNKQFAQAVRDHKASLQPLMNEAVKIYGIFTVPFYIIPQSG